MDWSHMTEVRDFNRRWAFPRYPHSWCGLCAAGLGEYTWEAPSFKDVALPQKAGVLGQTQESS